MVTAVLPSNAAIVTDQEMSDQGERARFLTLMKFLHDRLPYRCCLKFEFAKCTLEARDTARLAQILRGSPNAGKVSSCAICGLCRIRVLDKHRLRTYVQLSFR